MYNTQEGISKFENELKVAKENLKYIKEFVVIVGYWNNRSKFTYKSIAGDTEILFGLSDKFFSCGSFNTYFVSTVKRFLDRYELTYDVEHPNKKELMNLWKCLKSITMLYKTDAYRFWEIQKYVDSNIE